ncbi:imidazolonepropionase-like amidohydrolase [Povalibacter uvarum]|uniref:Imidazolonepropionase-like amidohydrolase n=1 Tax=Povalibacter uvarum TaxID=732238 RepID=A0A841HU63_9GAMM|nr:amidohydrolase family protein [Povalibacter uvarum]MBB6096343.1 imidazolonepropionase-like amidohydrolase [Povalibacter uvarum]
MPFADATQPLRLHLLLAVALVCAAGCSQKAEAPREIDLVIANAKVIDPGSRSVLEGAVIAIDDGRIVEVAPSLSPTLKAMQTIDAAGRSVVPAFADLHVHWGNGTFAESGNIVEQTLARNLYYGITRILNMGSNGASPAEIDSYRGKLADGTWQGPKLYAVGSLLTVPGSHPTTTIFPPDLRKKIAETVAAAPEQGPIDLMPLRAITLVRTADEVRTEVKRLASWGADAIKLTIESGPGPFGDDHPQMSEEIVRAAVEEAHAAKIPVIAHVSSRDELDVCLRTGVDAAAHSIITGPFDAELHQRMGAAGFFYVVTLDLYDGFLNWSADPDRMNDAFLRETLTDAEAASMQNAPKIFAREQEFFGKSGLRPILDHVRDAQRAGALLVTGTDTGNAFAFPGYGTHQELRLMVEAGVAPMDALAAATVNAAKFLKEENEWGSIQPGQAADLLILDGDPLADIMNTRRIAHVIQRGTPIDRSALRIR